MNIKSLILEIIIVFVVTLFVAALVTYLWNFLRHDLNAVDWDTAFILAITFAIALPLVDRMKTAA
jgi:hypothetical protein